MKINKKKVLVIFQILISTILLIFLFNNIGIKNIFSILANTDFNNILIIGFFSICPIVLAAFNFWVLLRLIHKINFFSFFKYYSYSNALSLIIPGSIGDVSIIAIVPKTNATFSSLSLVYILNKGISFLFNIIVAILGGLFLFHLNIHNIILFCFILIFVVGLVYYFLFKLTFKNRFINKIKNTFVEMFILLKIHKKNWRFLLLNLCITSIIWFLTSYSYLFCFKSLNVDIPFIYICTIPFIATLAGYIPLSFAGVGVVEYSAIGLFSTLGILDNTVLATYIILRSWQYLIALVSLAYFALFNKKTSNSF